MARSSSEPYNTDLLRQKVAAGSQDPTDYSNLANLAFEAGRYDEAVSLLQRALSLNLTNIERGRMYWELAWLFYSVERPEEALTQAEKVPQVLSDEPESPEVLFLRATAESLWVQCSADTGTGNNVARSALRGLNYLIAQAPNFENIAFAYAQAARLNNLLGNPEEAAKICQECLRKDLNRRERLDCLSELAEALRLAERYEEAERAVAEAINYTESDKARLPHLYSTLGLILHASNRPHEAREAFQNALAELEAQPCLPENPTLLKEVYWTLGRIHYKLEDYEHAVTTFQKLLALYPEDDLDQRNTLLWLGQCYQATGRLNEARNCYNRIVNSRNASEGEKASIQQGLGRIHYDLGEYDKAIAAFEKVLACFERGDPICCTSLLWLGYCYEAKSDYEKASYCYEQVQASPHASEEERVSAQEFLERLPPVSKKTLQ